MGEQKHILIIEDSQSLAGVLRDRLTAAGFTVDTAQNGEEGLQKATAKHPSLVLLDIIMPKLNGIDMLKELRDLEWAKHLLVMVLTNVESEKEVATCMELGVHDFMIKSDWKLDDIVAEVKQRLGA